MSAQRPLTPEQQEAYLLGYKRGMSDANVGLFGSLIGPCDQCNEPGAISRQEIWLCSECTATKTRSSSNDPR